MSENIPTHNVKQGALIGGVVCFALGMAIMAFSVWLVPVYGALLFAAFVLSIVAMSQRRVAGGVMLLLGCVILAPGLWLYLSMTRSARVLNKAADYIEQENLKQGIGIQTRPTPPVQGTVPRQVPNSATRAVPSTSSTGEVVVPENVKAIYGDNLAAAKAEEIAVFTTIRFETKANMENPEPRFTEDGKRLLYTRANESRGLEFVLRNLVSGKVEDSYQVFGSVARMMLSADSRKIAYLPSEFGNLHIIDLTTRKDIEIPAKGLDNADRIRWTKPNTIEFFRRLSAAMDVRALDLDSLVTSASKFRNDDPATKEYDRSVWLRPDLVLLERFVPERKDDRVHVLLRRTNGSFTKILIPDVTTKNYSSKKTLLASNDLRHVVLGHDGGLSIAYLHVTSSPRMVYWIDWQGSDPIQALEPGWQKSVQKYDYTFLGKVYGAQVNPLNQKPVGANKAEYKGLVRLSEWRDGSATATTLFEVVPFKEGDVVTDMGYYTTKGGDFELVHYENLNIAGWHTLTFTAPASSRLGIAPPGPSPTEAEPIAADDFRARTVESFLDAVQRKDWSVAARSIYPRVDAVAAEQSLRNFVERDERMNGFLSFRVLTCRTESPLARVVAETKKATGVATPVTFVLQVPKVDNEEDEIEGWDIIRIESASTFPSTSQTVSAAPAQGSLSLTNAQITSSQKMEGERFPETRMRALAPVDIRTWSDVKMQYAINEMFARHGAEFGNPATAKWFSQFGWYKLRAGLNFDDIEMSMMTDIERQNLQLLGAYRTAKREALKQGGGAQRDRRASNRRATAKQDEEEPNPLAELLLRSILKGLQNRR